MKKFIAILCSITLVLASIVVYGAADDGYSDGDITENPWGELFTTESTTIPDVTIPAETSEIVSETTTEIETSVPKVEAAEYDWTSVDFLGGEPANQYKAVLISGSIKEIVNIQKPDFATETGIYITFSDADFGEMTVNQQALSNDVQGAGIIAHLSNFTYKYSDVVIKNSDGTIKAVIYVYNEKGIDNGSGEVETTTPATTGAEETTPKETTPDITGAEETTPKETTPDTTGAEETTPKETTPATTGAEETTLEETTSDITVPETTKVSAVTTTKASTVKVAKTKVKKATKKLTAKKAKISLKKIKGATKYQIKISKKKNFKKKNIIVKKKVKKAKFTIKSKKLKNKTKLYIKARAIKIVNGKKYYGKWSKKKKIKIKR